ncbi:MAG: hypothetical protein ACK5H4_13560 [Lacrimispora sphenoides]
MKSTFRDFWRRFWTLVQDKSASLDIEKLSEDWKTASSNGKPAAYREVSIGNVLYRLTSIFEGSKDIDKTMERLAIQNAMSQPEPQKKA